MGDLEVNKISNEEIIKMSKEILDNEDYRGFKLKYIIKNREEQENTYAVATKDDEMIGFNPFEKEIHSIPDWAYNFDDDLFEELEWNKEIIYMTSDVHYSIWNDISSYYPEEFEHKEGVQEYLKYCKRNGIDKEYIQKENPNVQIDDVMKYLQNEKKRKNKDREVR